MPRKGHSPEQVLAKLRQVEVAVANGKSVGQAVRDIGVTDHTYYRWRREYGGTQPRPGKTAQEARERERKVETNRCRSRPGQADPERSGRGKLLSPSRRRKCVEHVSRYYLEYLNAGPAGCSTNPDRLSADH